MPKEDFKRDQGLFRIGSHQDREPVKGSQDPREQPEIEQPVDPRRKPEVEAPRAPRPEEELPLQPESPEIGPITPEPDRSPGQPPA